MYIVFSRFLMAAALGVAAIGGSVMTASAQPSAQHQNDTLLTKLVTRLDLMVAELTAARKAGRVSVDREAKIHERLVLIRKDSVTLARDQGFLSAAESATYNRMLDEIEVELAK